MERLVDPTQWERVGRGRELQFVALDEELQQFVLQSLPGALGPFLFVGADAMPEAGREGREGFLERPFMHPIDDLSGCLAAAADRVNLWIWPSVGLPPPPPPGPHVDPVASLSGLVCLQPGVVRRDGKRDIARISVVPQIRHRASGEVRKHPHANAIYAPLARAIEKALRFATVHTFRDGSTHEDRKLVRMTAGAALRSRESDPYVCRAGGELDAPE